MAALSDAAKFAFCVALGISSILKPLLDFLAGVSPLNPVLYAAVVVYILITLPVAYLMGTFLLQLQVAPAPALPLLPAPAASRGLACLACTMVSTLLLLLVVPLFAFWFLLAGGSPFGGGKIYII